MKLTYTIQVCNESRELHSLLSFLSKTIDEEDEINRKLLFQNYQVNEALLDQASSEVIFLHCLPAIRGEEISSDLLNDPRSRVWSQAENRLHAQKGLLVNLLGQS